MKTLRKRILKPFLHLLAIIFVLTQFSSQTFAQGKRVVIGSGSGYLDYPTAQTTLNLKDDDTVVINAGKYRYMNFKNITASPGHKITIINNGLVDLSDPSPNTFSNLINVEIRGDGTPGIDFGFYIHDQIRGISIDGDISHLYFSYFKMLNLIDYAIYMTNTAHVYDGTNNPNSLFYDMKFLHFNVTNISTSFIQCGGFTRVVDDGMINLTRKFEVAYCTVDTSPNEDLMHLNKVLNANIHHNKFVHIGLNNNKHSCMVYLYGNGDVHHNQIHDYFGSGMRAHAFSLDSIGAVNVYDNIMVDSRKYSGVEAKATEAVDLYSNPYLHYTNFKIYNNTFGNFTAQNWINAMVDTFDFLGGTIEIKNNLGFNMQRDKPYDPNWNYIYQKLNVGIPDTSNNLYSQNYAALGLVDDSLCFLNINSVAIDRGLNLPMITDDIDGIVRPQGVADDLGAREYVTGVIYPIANAGPDASTVLPADSILLDGSKSYNPGGGSLTYKWSQVSGPSTVLIVSDTLVKPMLQNLVQGTYQMMLTVTNSQGHTNQDIVVIVANAKPVYPPTANAGGTITITLPVNSSNLNGTASISNGGGALQYNWTKISGPASFTISGQTTATPLVSGLAQGTYQVQLTVTDTNSLSSSSVATIIVQPAPVPVANAGSDITITLPVNSATLDGSASTTPAGGSITYAWTKISGPASFSITGENTANPIISNLTAGVYEMNLTVTNVQGISAQAVVSVTVITPTPPVANAGSAVTLLLPVNSVALNGAASYDPGGSSITYSWAEIAGSTSAFSITGNTTTTPLISNLAEGTYQVQLTVTNTAGVSATSVVNITVNLPLLSVASAGHDTTINFPNGIATLDGSSSYSPNGTITSYHWVQFSGPTTSKIDNSSAAKTTATGMEPGVYIFQLIVADNYGQTSSTTVKVTVVSALRNYNAITLYPNPAIDLLHIHATTDSLGSLTIRVTNMSGIIMSKQTFQKTQLVFDQAIPVSQLPAGMYIVEVIMNNDVQLLAKFIKHR
jgi:Secretion system C-terminal sorting domain